METRFPGLAACKTASLPRSVRECLKRILCARWMQSNALAFPSVTDFDGLSIDFIQYFKAKISMPTPSPIPWFGVRMWVSNVSPLMNDFVPLNVDRQSSDNERTSALTNQTMNHDIKLVCIMSAYWCVYRSLNVITHEISEDLSLIFLTFKNIWASWAIEYVPQGIRLCFASPPESETFLDMCRISLCINDVTSWVSWFLFWQQTTLKRGQYLKTVRWLTTETFISQKVAFKW